MRYKVEDRVRVKSHDWYYNNRDRIDEVACGNTNFIPDMVKYCEGIVTILSILPTLKVYHIKEDGGMFNWTDEMIEGLVEEEVFIKANDIYNEEYSKGEYCHEQSFKWGFQEGYNYSHENDKLEISLKEGYQFKDENGNIINAQKIVLEKKKKEYPKTFEECVHVLEGENRMPLELMNTFRKLIDARNAYWKIAGEEMGLGKPWEPDWNNISDKYCIYFVSGDIWSKECQTRQCPFAFPTPEMRDAFYENFDPDIEFCKELL